MEQILCRKLWRLVYCAGCESLEPCVLPTANKPTITNSSRYKSFGGFLKQPFCHNKGTHLIATFKKLSPLWDFFPFHVWMMFWSGFTKRKKCRRVKENQQSCFHWMTTVKRTDDSTNLSLCGIRGSSAWRTKGKKNYRRVSWTASTTQTRKNKR